MTTENRAAEPQAQTMCRLLDLTGLPRGCFAVMSFVVIINPLAEGDPV